MLSNPKLSSQKFMSLLLTFTLILICFFLLNNSHTVGIQRIAEGSSSRSSEVKIPGEYVKYAHPVPSNTSYCKFNYGLPNKMSFSMSDVSGSPELGNSTPHYVLYNVIEGAVVSDEQPGITYATHITKEFAVFITEIVRYWEGPVSIAAYLPDGDPTGTLEQFLQFCYCIPEMHKVSLHFVFRMNSQSPEIYQNIYDLPLSVLPKTCDIQSLSKTEPPTTSGTSNSTLQTHLSAPDNWYPINICRNVAREAAYTKYVMVCDVELMPSKGLASRFVDMTESYKCKPTDPPCDKQVYVVPIFEVEATEDVPRSKKELLDLMRDERAVYFHKLTCAHCQKFPGLELWKETDPGDIVKPLIETKRESPYHRWEPIYIGTKLEPLYNERLSWEGFQDKMLQMLEMCLDNYTLVILDGAFLVHWPGIKKTKAKSIEPWRKPFKDKNQKHYNLLLKRLTAKYRPNRHCIVK